jgi:transposase-like protein/IS1 family transposase
MLCPICQGESRRYGKNRTGSQRYRCDNCAKTFTDESTRSVDRRRVDPQTMMTCLRLLLEGNSIRSLERTFNVGRNTIINTMVEAGKKCGRFMEAKIVAMPVENVRVDEIWGFVGMKEKTRQRLEAPETMGDVWCFTAIERDTKLILTWHVGKRSPLNTHVFADNLYHATTGRFQLTTDGFRPYLTAIPATLGQRVDYASLTKVYGKAPNDRGYSPGEVIEVVETVHLGNPDTDKICTSHVERSNKTLRMQIRRLTRLTDGCSKKWQNHEPAIALFLGYYNFCRVRSTIKMTPAHKARLTQETWSLERLLNEASRT